MKVIAVFGASASSPGDGHYEDGVRLGRTLVESGFAVATGGYGGLMEAVSRGAAAADGRVIGITAPGVFPGRSGANEYINEELRAASLTERIHELTHVADASIALHGSIGTLTEIVVAWNLAFVARFSESPPKPLITVGSTWRTIISDLTAILETDGSLVHCVDDVDAAVSAVTAILGTPRDTSDVVVGDD